MCNAWLSKLYYYIHLLEHLGVGKPCINPLFILDFEKRLLYGPVKPYYFLRKKVSKLIDKS